MPPFSPCGLAVDWVRSCHHGFWRFFANQPATLTGGQYYRLLAGSAHLKCPHLFFTADWCKGDRRHANQLGEVPGVDWGYRNGAQRGRIPPPKAIGQCADFADDWQFPPNVGPRTNRCGIDSRCYTQAAAPFVDADCLGKLDSPSLQMIYCQLVKLLYDAEDAKIREFIRCWFGPDAVLTIYPVDGLLPAMLIVQSIDVSLVVLSGTDGFQQLALQALQNLLGPTDYGEYSTLPLWFNTANVVFDRMITCGVAGPEPIVFAGHSYGASVCTILAVRCRLADTKRRIFLFTFGKPRSGDTRMRVVLASVPTVELANDTDIVTQLPPTGVEIEPFRVLLGPALYARWNRWVNFTEQTVMDTVGEQRLVPPPSLASNQLRPIILNALAGFAEPFIPGHTTEEYLRRLAFFAGPDECCVDAECWDIILPPVGPGQGGIRLGGAGELPRPVQGGIRLGGVGVVRRDFAGLGGIQLGGVGPLAPLTGSGGIQLGGVGPLAPLTGSGGIQLGGGGFPTIVGGGGMELGGTGATVRIHVGSGGIVLGSGGGPEALKGSGGIVLGSGGGPEALKGSGGIVLGSGPAPPTPGTSCASAGNLPFGLTVSGSVPVGIVHDWWTYTSTAGKTYTLTYTQIDPSTDCNFSKGASCASAVLITTFFASGSANYNEISTENGYIEVFFASLAGSGRYSLTLTET